MQQKIPTFSIYYPDDSDIFLIKEDEDFHNHVLNFVNDRLDGVKDYNDNVLCIFEISSTGIEYGEAKLEYDGYLQSLSSCLNFFQETEQYEKCKRIVKLQEIIKLQEKNELQ